MGRVKGLGDIISIIMEIGFELLLGREGWFRQAMARGDGWRLTKPG